MRSTKTMDFIQFSIVLLFPLVFGVKINFTDCQSSGWTCKNGIPNEINYSCDDVIGNNSVIHLKDFYTARFTSVTIQGCRNLKVILDCPALLRPSSLQEFKISDCGYLEFTTSAPNSIIQTPPEFVIENVREIESLPKDMFKSPTSNTELKCLGATSLRKIQIKNSKINLIKTKAIHNVTGIKNIEFENVTIIDMASQAIEAAMDGTGVFTMAGSRVNVRSKSLAIKTASIYITDNVFGDLPIKSLNLSSNLLQFTGNTVKDVYSDGIILKSINSDISNNHISTLKTNALASVKCSKKSGLRRLVFSRNTIDNIEPNSMLFNYASCTSSNAAVSFKGNRLDCRCRHIEFLVNETVNSELSNLILDVANNNTCLSAPCWLPVEIVKMLLDSGMCQINLDPQVMCLLYSDKKTRMNEITTDEDVTDAAPTFYLIRQANVLNGDTSAAMTAINKDDLLKDSHMNMTNRTAVKIVFDSSKDFVETLRSTNTRRRPAEQPSNPPRTVYTNSCVGPQCRNTAFDKQKALDFYKYVYAQLRSPKISGNRGNT